MTFYLSALLNQFLEPVILTRLGLFFGRSTGLSDIKEVPVPAPERPEEPLALFLSANNPSFEELILLLITLAPHVKPDFFDNVIQSFFNEPTEFYLIGGVRGKQFRGFLPTGETALFILAGNDLEKRASIQLLLAEDRFLSKMQIVRLEAAPDGEPAMSGKLIISQEFADLFILGKTQRPRFGLQFPARLIETNREWTDLVLNSQTMKQIKDLENWVRYGDQLLYEWNMKDILKPGYRVLFYGPPGTGKTLAATLLGKYTGKEVYKIDLSAVVSKFIGETEKNLSNLFERAAGREWILFFDEADALFGKRTGVRDAHDKYANQEVSYLLQQVETYPGLVILASNFKDNIDDAFIRRFQSVIYFPKPSAQERLRIWKKVLPKQLKEMPDGLIEDIAHDHELTGANIINIVQQLSLQALASRKPDLSSSAVLESIKRELAKEGRML